MKTKQNKSEWYTQLYAEFQRTARRHKILHKQCKEIEGNNRMGKTRDLFMKIVLDIKGIFYAKMNTMKDENGKDLTEAKEIKKRWQEYTEKC